MVVAGVCLESDNKVPLNYHCLMKALVANITKVSQRVRVYHRNINGSSSQPSKHIRLSIIAVIETANKTTTCFEMKSDVEDKLVEI